MLLLVVITMKQHPIAIRIATSHKGHKNALTKYVASAEE